ncbi:MAG TPA: dihydrodipicolinate synthase family protein [Bryobacteraceae bacterium]|nr:dihydrodipicolinate synthase family protein [Bryobacteraceae bacterium]
MLSATLVGMATEKQPNLASGVYAALATPRRSASIDADAAGLLDYQDVIIQAGIDGLVLFGSTGEFIHYDVTERMRVVILAIRRSRIPVLVNVSHSTLAGAMDLAENAIKAGAAGVLLMPPYFYRYPDEQILAFYEQFVKEIERRIPIYLYNLPAFTNPISAGLADRLLRSGDFAGIKDSSGDWRMFEVLSSLHSQFPFQLLVGSEELYLRASLAGADGIVSGVAAAVPELLVALQRALRSADTDRAGRLNARLDEFVEYVGKFPATVAIKQAGVARGWKLNQVAIPFDEDMSADIIAFHHWARGWLPAVLSECAEPAGARSSQA